MVRHSEIITYKNVEKTGMSTEFKTPVILLGVRAEKQLKRPRRLYSSRERQRTLLGWLGKAKGRRGGK
jgi:hypothetical protein